MRLKEREKERNGETVAKKERDVENRGGRQKRGIDRETERQSDKET